MYFDFLFEKIGPVSDELKSLIKLSVTFESFKQNAVMASYNRNYNRIYFVIEGLIKATCELEKKDLIFDFYQEGDFFFTPICSKLLPYQNQTFICLEDTKIFHLNESDFKMLRKNYSELEAILNNNIINSFLKAKENCLMFEFGNGIDRYNYFLKSYSSISNRLSLREISNFLGMTNVNLSRIRSDYKKKKDLKKLI